MVYYIIFYKIIFNLKMSKLKTNQHYMIINTLQNTYCFFFVYQMNSSYYIFFIVSFFVIIMLCLHDLNNL